MTASLLPRPDLPRGRQLLTPAGLAALLGDPSQQGCRLFEVGSGAPQQSLLQAHIPGAAYLDTEWLEHGPFWNKLADAELLALLLALGVRHDSTVLLYGRNSCAVGRAAHLLLYAGVPDVRMLDGGLAAWLRDGRNTAAGPPAARYPAQPDFGVPFPACPQYLSVLAQVQAMVNLAEDNPLVSIRSWDEHIGLTSGYSYIDAKGEIPGARWGRAGRGDDVNSMSAYQDDYGCLRPAAEIQRFWAEAGIVADKPAVFFCGTGWRASIAFFYAWLMGFEQISVFDGGWMEWSGRAGSFPSDQRSAPSTD